MLPVCAGSIQAVPLKPVALEDKKVWDEAGELSDVFEEVDVTPLFAFTSL